MFTELYIEEKREEGDRGGQEDKRGESKGERQIQPVISSLSVLQPVHSEGDQTWDFFGRNDAKSEASSTCEELTHWKRLRCWEGLGAGGKGDDRE